MEQMQAGQCRVGMVQTNCYGLMNKQTKEMILIDPGDSPETIVAMVDRMQGKPVAVFLTHGHFDHILAVKEIKEKYGIPVYAGREEADVLAEVSLNKTDVMHRPISVYPDVLVDDLEELTMAGFSVQVLHTPGHTKGSVCYYFPEEKLLVSGDTLFRESVGRTDLPTGNTGQIIESVRRLIQMIPEDVDVLPGHESATTIGHEKRYNPFV